ncbi:hypothetical protein [Streptomyces canus]|uniref:hypothetical protein n=1 Tax=Streptomyces canus TaxID=58343 RepID=UPI00039D2701|nr:hypothetical protein [Streptomyces canus]
MSSRNPRSGAAPTSVGRIADGAVGTGSLPQRRAPRTARHERSRWTQPALLLMGVMLAAVNMRAALAGTPPVLGDRRAPRNLGVFMGVVSPLAPKFGDDV